MKQKNSLSLNQKTIEQLEARLVHSRQIIYSNGKLLQRQVEKPVAEKKLRKIHGYLKKHALLEQFLDELISKVTSLKQQLSFIRKARNFQKLKILSDAFLNILMEADLLQEMQFKVSQSCIHYLQNQKEQATNSAILMVA